MKRDKAKGEGTPVPPATPKQTWDGDRESIYQERLDAQMGIFPDPDPVRQDLSHVSKSGAAHMVDVSGKKATLRRAVVEGFVLMAPGTFEALKNHTGPKGEVLSVARVAGIMAAKRTGELIPLCHPLPVEQVTVDFELIGSPGDVAETSAAIAAVRIVASATIEAKTGVEMEAYTAVTVAGLTIIDMLKAIDPGMHINGVRLLEKTGGKADYRAR